MTVWTTTNVAARHPDGRPKYIIETARDITARIFAEEEIKHHAETRAVLNKILSISLKDISLNTMLKEIIDTLVSIPWMAFEAKGGIWLKKPGSKILSLAAQNSLPPELIKKCSTITLGHCICGKTAKSGKLIQVIIELI